MAYDHTCRILLVTSTLFISVKSYWCVAQHPTPLIVSFEKDSPTCTIETTYAVGSRDDPANACGVSHVLEHVMFDGTSHTSPGEYAYWIQSVGGSYQGSTGLTRTVYVATVPPVDLDLVLYLENDRDRNLELDPDLIEADLPIVKREIELRALAPREQSRVFALGTLALTDAVSCPPQGTVAGINNVTERSLHHLYDNAYSHRRSLVVVAGSCKEASVGRAVERYYGKGVVLSTQSPELLKTSSRVPAIYKVVTDEQFHTVHLAFRMGSPDEVGWYSHMLFGMLLASDGLWTNGRLSDCGLAAVPTFHIQAQEGGAIATVSFRFLNGPLMHKAIATPDGLPLRYLNDVTTILCENALQDMRRDVEHEWRISSLRAEQISQCWSLYHIVYSPRVAQEAISTLTRDSIKTILHDARVAFASPTSFLQAGTQQ